MVDKLQLPTWMARLLKRAERDGAAFTDMPGFVFGGPARRGINDGEYGDPHTPPETYVDEDGTEWQATNTLTRK